MAPLIERQRRDAVAILAMNRPERRNALSNELVAALLEALNDAEHDPEVRAVVLTGSGGTFCAGGDLADGLSGSRSFLEGHEQRGAFCELLERIPSMATPVVAAVQGSALGGGCGLAAACDLVVAEPDARLGTPEIRLGLFPWVILAVLQRDVPRKRLLELVLTGERIEAGEAKAIGLINRVSMPGRALDEAVELASAIAARSPAVVGLGKRAFHQISDLGYQDALRYMHAQLSLNLLMEDAMEGVAAFLQKREPAWKGR